MSIVNEARANPVIVTLQQTWFRFYLTGSRHFGGAGLTSNWDLFAQDSSDIRRWLESKDFVPLDDPDYESPDTARVYIHKEHNVLVQLQTCVEVKIRAQAIVEYLLKHMVKFNLRRISDAWVMAMELSKYIEWGPNSH